MWRFVRAVSVGDRNRSKYADDCNFIHQSRALKVVKKTSRLRALCNLIAKDYNRKLERLDNQIDSKLRSKIEKKKAAHGLKTERGVQQNRDDEDYEMRM